MAADWQGVISYCFTKGILPTCAPIESGWGILQQQSCAASLRQDCKRLQPEAMISTLLETARDRACQAHFLGSVMADLRPYLSARKRPQPETNILWICTGTRVHCLPAMACGWCLRALSAMKLYTAIWRLVLFVGGNVSIAFCNEHSPNLLLATEVAMSLVT